METEGRKEGENHWRKERGREGMTEEGRKVERLIDRISQLCKSVKLVNMCVAFEARKRVNNH